MNSARYNVVAVGIACMDVIAAVEPQLLTEFGIPLNAGIEVDAQKLNTIWARFGNSELAAGGPSANTASVVAALGGKAGFFGKLAADKSGDLFLQDFQERGVEMCCELHDRTARQSAICLCLTTGAGNRSSPTM